MPVNDAEPRHQFSDPNGNVIGSIYFDEATDEARLAFDNGTEVVLGKPTQVGSSGTPGVFDSVSAGQLNNRVRIVSPGDSIQAAIDDLRTNYSVGVVWLEGGGSYNQSGIDVAPGIRVVGAGSDASGAVVADSDQYVFQLQGGKSQLANLRIETDQVTGYSSDAVSFNDSYSYGRYWKYLDNVNIIGNIGSANGDAGVGVRSFNGSGIAWLYLQNVVVVGHQYGVLKRIASNSDYINACVWDGIQIQQSTRGVFEDDNSTGGGEIDSNWYRVGSQGSADTDEVVQAEGSNGTWHTTIFDPGSYNNSPIQILGNDNKFVEHASANFANVNNQGDRTVFGANGGRSYTTSASPGSGSSVWDGHEDIAFALNVTVEDRSVAQPRDLYQVDRDGNWVQIG